MLRIRLCWAALAALLSHGAAMKSQTREEWQTVFSVDKKTLGVTGANPYFNLTPGYHLSYKHKKDTDVVTVLNETKLIDGVTTRVVEDRETDGGKLTELTRDYYAIDSIFLWGSLLCGFLFVGEAQFSVAGEIL